MNEAQTRKDKIDPKLRAVGWDMVPESKILVEQLVYPGHVQRIATAPKKADYVLAYRGVQLAIIEAKSDEKDVSEGVEQAKEYAQKKKIRYTYSCNGDEIYFIDMGLQDNEGKWVAPSKEYLVPKFPSPQELWLMTYPKEHEWRDKFNLCPLNRDGGREPRYYQEVAIRSVLDAVANEQPRILLTMATGTGKTYTAFQICWKLFQTGWNKEKSGLRKPRILFITDRNTLADQARNDFDNFKEDAMVRINPKLLHGKVHQGKVPTGRSIYFTIFQTFMARDAEGTAYYMQYPKDFFDFIIIDECHRGGANDESEWRELMDYFKSAYQLGMTATPRTVENANTYAYFGKPVYSYSLKQGIEDGYLTPFRVEISRSNIDDYQWQEGDEVKKGDIDQEKTYEEKDFYHGNIEIRERDEHRVKEFLNKIDPDEKTIVFCATQKHAAVVRDMINQHKRRPQPDYCKRVTADDSEEGERWLKLFQNNDRQIPTILTSSQKLSTGVDARNVRNIVLMRPIGSMIEFKQIIGRGTRLFDNKYYFTIFDFVGAHEKFQDDGWDGTPICPKCGNWPCTCNKKPKPGPYVPKPHVICPICGNDPCTCDGKNGTAKKTVVVKLGAVRSLLLETQWTEKFMFGDELVTMKEFIQKLFGRMPDFFGSEEDLREKWSQPQTRKDLLDMLQQEGFAEDKLEMMRRMLNMEKCDLLDVLEYIAYSTPAIERVQRVAMIRKNWLKKQSKARQEFLEYILDYYQRNDYKELGQDKLYTFLQLKYGSLQDALRIMGIEATELLGLYLTMQKELYREYKSMAYSESDEMPLLMAAEDEASYNVLHIDNYGTMHVNGQNVDVQMGPNSTYIEKQTIKQE